MFETFVVKMFALAGVFFAGVNPDVEMETPVIESRNDLIAVSCLLVHPLSDDLANVIESGTEVRLSFVCRLRRGNGTPTDAADLVVTHTVSKNLGLSTYDVDLVTRTAIASQMNEYSVYFRLETVPLWPIGDLGAGEKYIVEVSARLEPIYIRSTGETYDLMSLWNFKVPKNRSELFGRDDLVQRRVRP